MSTRVVPFFRPSIGLEEMEAVQRVLESGWLTSGEAVKRFEEEFAEACGARYAVALNSATAALHLAVEALGLVRGSGVLVPTHTFAATAEVVRYFDAIPILVDCDAGSLFIDLDDAGRKLAAAQRGTLLKDIGPIKVTGMIPVHVGGAMGDMVAVTKFAKDNGLWVVEDAAHSFPAAYRVDRASEWTQCGQGTSSVACFSFYANKTITTGEGGMAVTDDESLAARMRLMSLHGLSRDAWSRYSAGGAWDYQIVAPGFKYNLTDVAAALGIAQLKKAEQMRLSREAVAKEYRRRLAGVAEIELPAEPENRIHAWHLFPIRLRLETLTIDRADFIQELKRRGIQTAVHWRPLHLHNYYVETYRWTPNDLPTATAIWPRLVSLPLFPSMTSGDLDHVVACVADVCRQVGKSSSKGSTSSVPAR